MINNSRNKRQVVEPYSWLGRISASKKKMGLVGESMNIEDYLSQSEMQHQVIQL